MTKSLLSLVPHRQEEGEQEDQEEHQADYAEDDYNDQSPFERGLLKLGGLNANV